MRGAGRQKDTGAAARARAAGHAVVVAQRADGDLYCRAACKRLQSVSSTIYDLAEHVGVSIATVSRALSGRGHVAASTRERIFAAAHELGYEPDVSARSLARQRTHLVSVVVPSLTSSFYMEVIHGIQDRLAESDYDLLVFPARDPEHVDAPVRRALQKGRADGLLLASTPLTAERAAVLMDARNPVILVDSSHPAFDSVSVNNREGGFTATQHLLDAGRRRIAHIAPNAVSVPGAERRRGYEDALRAAGRALDPGLVVETGTLERHGFTEEEGRVAMERLLARPERPDAVFAASDAQALGALGAIQRAGLRVPDDIALVGFDDVPASAYVGLTTLRQPMYEMGRVATEKLLQRLAEPDRPVSTTAFAASLVARATTGASAPTPAAPPPASNS